MSAMPQQGAGQEAGNETGRPSGSRRPAHVPRLPGPRAHPLRWLWQQFVDSFAYWLFPCLCFLLPARAANTVARFLSGQAWLYRFHAENGRDNMAAVLKEGDPEQRLRTLRLVRFLDAVDAWHGHFSSDRRIARHLVSGPERWPEADSLVLLGTHLGPSTLFLRCLAAAGYTPRFVFRDIPRNWLFRSPVYYAHLRFRMAYLRRVCRGKEIRVPGGRDAVARSLGEPGVGLVLLLDAPAGHSRARALSLLGHRLPVDPRGLGMAVEKGATAALFAMTWDAASGKRVIEVSDAGSLSDRDATLARMGRFLDERLARDPAQWQLWTTAQAVLQQAD